MQPPGLRERLLAAAYDRFGANLEREVYAPRRRALLAGAYGRVLDIGCGTGANLPYFSQTPSHVTDLVLLDASRGMLARAERKAAELGLTPELMHRDAEQLPFEDAAFDTLVVTLALCSVPQPAAALREAHRVLKPTGQLLVLEHVRSSEAPVAIWQDRLNGVWRTVNLGCNVNRATRASIEGAGFDFERVDEFREPRIPLAIVQPQLVGVARKRAQPAA